MYKTSLADFRLPNDMRLSTHSWVFFCFFFSGRGFSVEPYRAVCAVFSGAVLAQNSEGALLPGA